MYNYFYYNNKKTMEKIEKGTIIEVKVPNIEKPIKAVVLDVIVTGDYEGDFSTITYYTYILYAQKRLFKASNKCRRGTCTSITEEDEPREIKDFFKYCSLEVNHRDKSNWLREQVKKLDIHTIYA